MQIGCRITDTDLQDVSHLEGNSCLCTRDEVVLQRVVVKLRSDIDLLVERLLATMVERVTDGCITIFFTDVQGSVVH